MAVFNEQYLERVDWAILQNGWIAMYFQSEVLTQDVEWLEQHRYKVHELDCLLWASPAVALAELGKQFEFPDYYGCNLNALHDCLGDLRVPDEGGVAIVLRRYDHYAAQHQESAQAILEIFAENARRLMLFGKRLAVLVQSDNPRLSFDAVGATPVAWNRREWLDADRGL